MKILAIFFLLTISLAWADDDPDAWQHQSYQQSKRLPDLHHAVDVKLLDGMEPPLEFELKDGKLACKTCHGLENMADTAYDKIDKKAANFLRGGLYPKLQTFCFNCHNKKDHERPNIHEMLDDSGEIKKHNCLYCHEEVHEKRDQRLESSQLKLRLPPEKLCFGCHLKSPHLNAVEHQGAKPKEKMKKHMQQKADDYGVILPLAEDGKVTCISCHSPHPQGVMREGNPAGAQVSGDVKKGVAYDKHSWDQVYRDDKRDRLDYLAMMGGESYQLDYQRLKTEVLLRLPAKDGSLCLSCHQFER